MKILLDDTIPHSLFPFGIVRSPAHIRIGILTIFEKWQWFFPGKVFIASEKILADVNSEDCIIYPANFVPSVSFLQELSASKEKLPYSSDCYILEHPWQIFENNSRAILEDYEMITKGRISEKIDSSNQTLNPASIFMEAGAEVRFSILNAENGPIYIGKNAVVEEGSLIRGPVAIGEDSRVKMGTRIYGATTLGPKCLAGGEIKNSVMIGYSNKGHDGYLGDSVIGEWCNLGAGTSNSNLKNNAAPVKIWNQEQQNFVVAGTKCGLMMGDYSRSSINTSFNTGTVVGICCSIFGNGHPPKFIESFSWGNELYEFEKAIRDITNWKKLKDCDITQEEIKALKNIYPSNKKQ